jgi:hypothetical protein
MTAHADVAARPAWLRRADGAAFDRYLGARRQRPLGAALLAVIDLDGLAPRSIERFGAGIGWQHCVSLAEVLLLDAAAEAAAMVAEAEPVRARLRAAIEALDARNIWLVTGPVK